MAHQHLRAASVVAGVVIARVAVHEVRKLLTSQTLLHGRQPT